MHSWLRVLHSPRVARVLLSQCRWRARALFESSVTALQRRSGSRDPRASADGCGPVQTSASSRRCWLKLQVTVERPWYVQGRCRRISVKLRVKTKHRHQTSDLINHGTGGYTQPCGPGTRAPRSGRSALSPTFAWRLPLETLHVIAPSTKQDLKISSKRRHEEARGFREGRMQMTNTRDRVQSLRKTLMAFSASSAIS
jgi:hypothetical protein